MLNSLVVIKLNGGLGTSMGCRYQILSLLVRNVCKSNYTKKRRTVELSLGGLNIFDVPGYSPENHSFFTLSEQIHTDRNNKQHITLIWNIQNVVCFKLHQNLTCSSKLCITTLSIYSAVLSL